MGILLEAVCFQSALPAENVFPKVRLQNEMPVTRAQLQERPAALSSGQPKEDSTTLGSWPHWAPGGGGGVLIYQRVCPRPLPFRASVASFCYQPLHTPVLSEAFPASPGEQQFDLSCFPTWVWSCLPPSLLRAHDCLVHACIFHSSAKRGLAATIF